MLACAEPLASSSRLGYCNSSTRIHRCHDFGDQKQYSARYGRDAYDLACDNPDPLIRLQLMIERGYTRGVVPSTIRGRLEQVIRPRNLMVAIALQTVWHMSGEQERAEERTGVRVMQCDRCGKRFEAGPERSGAGPSKFCSPKCGNEFVTPKESAKPRRIAVANPKTRMKPGQRKNEELSRVFGLNCHIISKDLLVGVEGLNLSTR